MVHHHYREAKGLECVHFLFNNAHWLKEHMAPLFPHNEETQKYWGEEALPEYNETHSTKEPILAFFESLFKATPQFCF